MADSTDKAKRKREIIRGVTKKVFTATESELKKDAPNVDILEELLMQLTDTEALLKDLDTLIEDGIENLEEFETEVSKSQEYMEEVLTWKTRISRSLKRNRSPEIGSEENSAAKSSTAPAASLQNTVRLPRLTIPKFSGDITEWQSFWTYFDSAFHQNQNLTKIHKLNYLNSLLEGTPASAISGLTATDDNYDTALRILKERFESKELAISAHENKLLTLSPVQRITDSLFDSETNFGWTIHGPTAEAVTRPVAEESAVGVMKVCVEKVLPPDQAKLNDFKISLQFLNDGSEIKLRKNQKNETKNMHAVMNKCLQGHDDYNGLTENNLEQRTDDRICDQIDTEANNEMFSLSHQDMFLKDETKRRQVASSLNENLTSRRDLKIDFESQLLPRHETKTVSFAADMEPVSLSSSPSFADREAFNISWIKRVLEPDKLAEVQTTTRTRDLFSMPHHHDENDHSDDSLKFCDGIRRTSLSKPAPSGGWVLRIPIEVSGTSIFQASGHLPSRVFVYSGVQRERKSWRVVAISRFQDAPAKSGNVCDPHQPFEKTVPRKGDF